MGPSISTPHEPLQYDIRIPVASWLGTFIGLNSPLLLCRPPLGGSETLDLCKHIFRKCKGQARRCGMIIVGELKAQDVWCSFRTDEEVSRDYPFMRID